MKWQLAVLLLLAGCAHTEVRVDSARSARTQGGLQVQIQGGRGLATLVGLGVLTAAMFDYARGWPSLAPALSPERRVNEHDCTRPIEEPSANLKCR